MISFDAMWYDPKRTGSLRNSHAFGDYTVVFHAHIVTHFKTGALFAIPVDGKQIFFVFVVSALRCRCFEVNIYVSFHFVDFGGKTINLCRIDELFTSILVAIYLFHSHKKQLNLLWLIQFLFHSVELTALLSMHGFIDDNNRQKMPIIYLVCIGFNEK